MARPAAHRSITTVLVVAFAAILIGVVQPRPASAGSSPFTDIAGHRFEADIEWLSSHGITVGCTPTLFCPDAAVTRAQMASFLVRMFDLTAGGDIDAFTDDDGTTHEADINRLAAAGITTGCTATTFCPLTPVRRDEMASFLARAVPLTVGAGDNYFRDDDGTTHEADIDRLAAAGITTGCGMWRFCPRASVTRGEMAAFLRRVEEPIAAPAHPAPGPGTLYVTTTGADAGNSCLVEASPCRRIKYALALAIDGDAIDIGPGTFAEEDLTVHADVSIAGDPGGGTTIDATGGGRRRVLTVPAGRTVDLADLRLTGGRADFGGGIQNTGTLTLSNVTVTANRASRWGGGIYNVDGTLTLTESVISANEATFLGGGLYSEDRRFDVDGDANPLVIEDSSFVDNRALAGAAMMVNNDPTTVARTLVDSNVASSDGAGIFNSGPITITQSTISLNVAGTHGGGVLSATADSVAIVGSTINDNSAIAGAGIYFYGVAMTIANSTITANSAFDLGGGIEIDGGLEAGDGHLTMLNSTVTQNEAPKGAGLARESGNPNAGLTLRNTLVMGNGRQEIYNIPTVRLASIVGVPAGLTLAEILDPAGLGDHGGPTLTIALVESAANPAIEAGQASTCAAAPVSGLDQRGLPRVAPCDIGAFEVQP